MRNTVEGIRTDSLVMFFNGPRQIDEPVLASSKKLFISTLCGPRVQLGKPAGSDGQ